LSFAETVKKIRIENNLTQQAFADALGVSFATINRWENGIQAPSPMAKKLVSEYCKVKGLTFAYTDGEIQS
jgi:DNA-binding transcriptional regulator YiaG